MSDSQKIQIFLEKNKFLFEDFDFSLDSNDNILKIYNIFSGKYQEILKHPIKHPQEIYTNFKNTKVITKKNRKKLKGGKPKTIRKKFDELSVYLNNIDTCDGFIQKGNFRSKYIQILNIIFNKYNNILQEIYKEHDNTDKKIKNTNEFITNINNKKLSEVIEWANFHGILISRSIYVMFLNRRLPEEINNLFGSNPELLGEFTSLDVQYDIELNLPYTYFYNYKINGINLVLETHYRKKLKNIKQDKNLLYRIFFLNFISNRNDINLKLWYSNRKKNLPQLKNKEQKYLGAREINSGCTTFIGELPNKVSIWRREEINKVLLHELCHSLELEEHQSLQDVKEFIYNHFDIKREIPVRIFESYVETWANFLNVLIIIKEKDKRKKIFLNLLEIEIKWSLFQAAKILNFFGYQSFEDFYFLNGIKEENKTPKFLQKSNIFSYTIARSIIMFNLDFFMGLCLKYNPENLLIQDKIPQDEKINLLKRNINSYSKIINKIINFFRKNKNDNYVFQSTRLSCVE